jgi:hypothetical protein
MKEAKRMELKSIQVSSAFKFFGGIFLVVGLIIGLFGNLVGINIMSDKFHAFPFVAKLGPGIFTGIIFGIVYGLIAGIVASIHALLYNFFAALLGGLRFDLKE